MKEFRSGNQVCDIREFNELKIVGTKNIWDEFWDKRIFIILESVTEEHELKGCEYGW